MGPAAAGGRGKGPAAPVASGTGNGAATPGATGAGLAALDGEQASRDGGLGMELVASGMGNRAGTPVAMRDRLAALAGGQGRGTGDETGGEIRRRSRWWGGLRAGIRERENERKDKAENVVGSGWVRYQGGEASGGVAAMVPPHRSVGSIHEMCFLFVVCTFFYRRQRGYFAVY